MTAIRPAEPTDAAELAALYSAQRAFLAPFDPVRPTAFYGEQGQRDRLQGMVAQRAAGLALPFVIVDADEIVGMVNVSNIVRGVLCSGNVGYWVAEERCNRGIATMALRLCVAEAFDSAGLHRLDAGTLLTNVASQRVLLKAGFRSIGVARHYLFIGEAWRDHLLFGVTVEDRLAAPPAAGTGIRVRAAGDRDGAALAELTNGVAREPDGFLLGLGGDTGRVERRRVRALRGSRDGGLLVAERHGVVVGRVDVARDPHPYAAHVAELGVAVARDARRAGVGSALLRAAFDWCRERGIAKVEAHVFCDNAGSLTFFRRHGFDEEGLRQGRYVRAGERRDVLLLARSLEV